MNTETQRFGRWQVSFLMETHSVDEDRWPPATLYDRQLDDPMAGALLGVRDANLGPGREGRGVPRVLDVDDDGNWMDAEWIINGRAERARYEKSS